MTEFDFVVPIPLSPEKVSKSEIHRSHLLAKAIARQFHCRVGNWLQLSESISKRMMVARGYTTRQFEDAYYAALNARVPKRASSVLLVDYVITHGSTIATALRRLYEANEHLQITIATVGQMIVKDLVADESVITSGC